MALVSEAHGSSRSNPPHKPNRKSRQNEGPEVIVAIVSCCPGKREQPVQDKETGEPDHGRPHITGSTRKPLPASPSVKPASKGDGTSNVRPSKTAMLPKDRIALADNSGLQPFHEKTEDSTTVLRIAQAHKTGRLSAASSLLRCADEKTEDWRSK